MMWPFNKLFKSPKGKKLTLLSCQIHGSHYYKCFELIEQSVLHKGQVLVLRREPKNEYDGNAIEVFTDNKIKIGYIPKQLNQVIATLMDQGCKVEAKIDSIHTKAWEPVTIKIYCRGLV